MDKISTLSTLTAPQKPKTASKIAKAAKTRKSENLGEAFEPSDAVIDRILAYSKALSVKPSKSIGYVENLLN